MKILIDNGHGVNTKGKCSPDGTFREYAWAREIAQRIEKSLKAKGYDAERIVPEETDISLTERCRRVNAFCNQIGTKNVILVSIHANAAGADGEWKKAGGWSVYTSPGKTDADKLAAALWDAANISLKPYIVRFSSLKAQGAYDSRQVPLRADWSDGDADYEERFTVLTGTKCPAVLTENLFQDNKEDVAYLLSEAGKQAIVDCHVNGIINYINSKK